MPNYNQMADNCCVLCAHGDHEMPLITPEICGCPCHNQPPKLTIESLNAQFASNNLIITKQYGHAYRVQIAGNKSLGIYCPNLADAEMTCKLLVLGKKS